MKVQVLSPQGTLLQSAAATAVTLPGSKGAFTVLTGHAAIISTLTKGDVRVKEETGEERHCAINGGVVEVLNDEISICVTN